MKLSVLSCVALSLLLAPAAVMAQSISLDVQRVGGIPQLDANGDWVWEVFYNTDADGGAASIELGFEFADSDVVSGSVTFTGIGGGGVEVANPGALIFGWETLNGDGNPEGLQVDASQGTNGQAFYTVGTGVLAGSSSLLLATFTTEGPDVVSSLKSSISVLGAYDAAGNTVLTLPGTHGLVSQSTGATAVNAFAMIEAILGDVNLDGVVDASDLAIVDANLGPATGGWGVGDLDGSGVVDAADRMIVSDNQIPEPTALALLAALATLACGIRRV